MEKDAMKPVDARVPSKRYRQGHVKESNADPYIQAALVVIFVVMSFTFLYPYWHVLVNSFTHPDYASAAGFRFLPKVFSVDAYRQMFSTKYLWSGYRNTIVVVLMGWSLSIIGVVLCAYPLSKRDLPLRGLFTTIIIVTMFVSGGMIPTYLLVSRTLSLKNTFWAIVLPQCISTSHVVITRNYFMQLPQDLEEAATIDGANSLVVMTRVILPLSMPILATISLWVIVSNWNAYFNCLLYITDPNKLVLQVVLRRIILTDSKEMTAASDSLAKQVETDTVTLKAASIMLATIPIICVYPFLQKYFVKGVLIGSLKG